MRLHSDCSIGSIHLRNGQHSFFLAILFCFAGLFFSTSLFAQTISFPTSCTSKDLTLLKASLPAPAGDRCACSGDRSLILGIHNGTSSVRTSFALWGTLHRYDATGAEILPAKSIFACAGPIGKSGDYFLNATTIKIDGLPASTAVISTSSGNLTLPVIHIECGQSLDITDMHLAWTSANNNETCDVLYNNPSTINPKCGVQDLIHVDLGVNGNLLTANATCTTNGRIRVDPYGGLAPYSVCLYKKNSPTDSTLISTCRTVAANDSTIFTNVATGDYTVRITDNMNEPDVTKRCFTNKTTSIVNPDNVSAPNCTVTDPACRQTTGTVNVSSPQVGIIYTLEKPLGTVLYTAVSGVFSNVIPDTYTLKATKGACSAIKSSVTVSQPPAIPTTPSPQNNGPLCTGGTLNLTTSAVANATYNWTGPNSFASTGQNPSITSVTAAAAGTYQLTVTVNNCTSNVGTTIVSIDQPPTAATAGADQTRCGSLVSLGLGGNTPSVGTGTWSKKSGPGTVSFSANANAPNATATVSVAGSYVFTWTIHNGVCTDSKEDIAVNFYDALTAPSVCVVQPTLCGDATGKVKFSIPGSGYQYSIKNGALNSWQDCPVFLNVAAGSVTGLVIKNADGCVSTPASCTTMCPANEVIEACTTSPLTTLAKDNTTALIQNEPKVRAFPNPFNDKVKFVVTTSFAGNGSLEIYNMLGQRVKTVYQGHVNAGEQSFDLTIPKKQQATLIYIFRVDSKQVTGKLLQLNN
jgi:hypothetical protein